MPLLFSFSRTAKEEYLSQMAFYYRMFSYLTHQYIFYLEEFPFKHIRKDFSPVGEPLLARPLFRVLPDELSVKSPYRPGQRIL